MRADRRYLLYGLAAWAGVTALYSVVLGFRRMAGGLAYYDNWWQLWNNVVPFAAGALLSIALFPLFERISRHERFSTTLLLYTALGVAYWVSWSLLRVAVDLAGLTRYAAGPPPLGDHLVRSLVFTAYIALTLYAVMVMLFEAFRHLGQSRRAEVEAAQLQAELEVAQAAALRARLNPDFVFETFRLVAELMATDVRAARRVLSDLSELLRVSLGREGHRLVPLGDEMEMVKRYLSIQRARPGWRARVEVELSDGAAACAVPPLLFQPLLESAVQQGVGRGEGGEIELRAGRGEGGVVLAITARAPAWPAGEVLLERHAASVELTRARLALAYGEHASLGVSCPAPDAFVVEMRLPEISEEPAIHA